MAVCSGGGSGIMVGDGEVVAVNGCGYRLCW